MAEQFTCFTKKKSSVNPKAEPKKGTIKISPNKTLQSFLNVAASPKIHVPVTAAIIS